MLVSDSSAVGDSTTYLPEGNYSVTLEVIEYDGTRTNATSEIFVTSSTRIAVYDKLRLLPYAHEFKFFSNDYKEWDSILLPIYTYSLLTGLVQSNLDLKIDDNLNILRTLQRLTS
jgi:PKD repeat protein